MRVMGGGISQPQQVLSRSGVLENRGRAQLRLPCKKLSSCHEERKMECPPVDYKLHENRKHVCLFIVVNPLLDTKSVLDTYLLKQTLIDWNREGEDRPWKVGHKAETPPGSGKGCC